MVYISKIAIKNFRNFEEIEICFKKPSPIVIIGETQSGKSNLLFALRLLLDETLTPDEATLSKTDFNDISKPIDISVELACDITHDLVGVMMDYYHNSSTNNTVIAKIGYYAEYKNEELENGYYTGNQPPKLDDLKSNVSAEFKECFKLGYLDALRDVEKELANKLRSPLRYALERIEKNNRATEVSKKVKEQSDALNNTIEGITDVTAINDNVVKSAEVITGSRHKLDYKFKAQPLELTDLLKNLQLSFKLKDENASLAQASLGTNNALFLALKKLLFTHEQFRKPPKTKKQQETPFVWLAIEEPEAHLHPQLQRTVYNELAEENGNFSPIITTHSPHLVSVTDPLNLVLLKRVKDKGTEAKQLQKSDWEEKDLTKIQSYLQVTRAEMLFAAGVILVEGIAEKHLMQAWFPKLDGEGISVCSIDGTDFDIYVKFLKAFTIPYVIITDGDPKGEDDTSNHFLKEHPTEKNVTIFSNDLTFEFELYKMENFKIFINSKLPTRQPKKEDPEQRPYPELLADKSTFKEYWKKADLNKGMLAKDLATEIIENREKYPAPKYIQDAVECIRKKVGVSE